MQTAPETNNSPYELPTRCQRLRLAGIGRFSFLFHSLFSLWFFLTITLMCHAVIGAEQPTTAEMYRIPNAGAPQAPNELVDRAFYGYYSPERQYLHEQIVQQLLGTTTAAQAPQLIFTAGPMGAGKTTVLRKLDARGLLSLQNFVSIDLDQIRKLLPEYEKFIAENRQNVAARTQEESGYIASLLLERALQNKRNVVFDSSMQNQVNFDVAKEKILRFAPQYTGRLQLLFVRSDLATVLQRIESRNRTDSRYTAPSAAEKSYFLTESGFSTLSSSFDSVAVVDTTSDNTRLVYVEHSHDGKRKTQGTSLPFESIDKSGGGLFESLTQAAMKRPANSGYDLFLDIDWTLFYSINDPSTVPPKELIKFDGPKGPEFYRASDQASWLFEKIAMTPDLRAHIFSAGTEERNSFLLKQIKLSDGRTALDIVKNVFSVDAITPISQNPNQSLSERNAKYVQKLLPNIDMTRTILVDDISRFARLGLKVIPAQGNYNFRSQFDVDRVGQTYEAPSAEAFRRERQKLVMVWNMIEESYRADRAGTAMFADHAESLARDPVSGVWHDILSPKLARYFAERVTVPTIELPATIQRKPRNSVPVNACRALFQ